jgi:pimeloyl-ACP methyl ester carboxylesterase
VLLDYPPRHTGLRVEWVEGFAQSVWRGRRADEVIDIATIKAIQSESVAKNFIPALSSIEVPTLVIRGHQPGAALSQTDADVYKSSMPHCDVLTFEDSAHALWEPDSRALSLAVGQFTRTIEHQA